MGAPRGLAPAELSCFSRDVMKKKTSALNLLELVYTGAYIQRPVRFLRGPHGPSIIPLRHRIQPNISRLPPFLPSVPPPKTGASPMNPPYRHAHAIILLLGRPACRPCLSKRKGCDLTERREGTVGALKAMAPAMDARATTTLSIVCSCTNRVRNQLLVRKTTNSFAWGKNRQARFFVGFQI
jgi:hypothetical protein